jgi:hypothetical protein
MQYVPGQLQPPSTSQSHRASRDPSNHRADSSATGHQHSQRARATLPATTPLHESRSSSAQSKSPKPRYARSRQPHRAMAAARSVIHHLAHLRQPHRTHHRSSFRSQRHNRKHTLRRDYRRRRLEVHQRRRSTRHSHIHSTHRRTSFTLHRCPRSPAHHQPHRPRRHRRPQRRHRLLLRRGYPSLHRRRKYLDTHLQLARRSQRQPLLRRTRHRRPRLQHSLTETRRRRPQHLTPSQHRLRHQRHLHTRPLLLHRRRPDLADVHALRRRKHRATATASRHRTSRQRSHRGRLGRLPPTLLRRHPQPRLLQLTRWSYMDAPHRATRISAQHGQLSCGHQRHRQQLLPHLSRSTRRPTRHRRPLRPHRRRQRQHARPLARHLPRHLQHLLKRRTHL